MSALTCDICGGKLKVMNGKMAVCDSCGMEHSLERVREKYRESQEVIHVDTAHLIGNYFCLAQDAYKAGNKEEAEKYCNKIVEIDSLYTDALLLKGKAVGWQSRIGSLRFKEATLCFVNAVESCATDIEKQTIHLEIQDEFSELATALIQLRCDRFQKWPDDEESNGFKNDLYEISDAIEMYSRETSLDIDRNHVFNNVASVVQYCMFNVSMNILLEYRTDGSKRAYSEFVTKTDNCIDIMKKTIDLCDDDDKSDIQLYERIIGMQTALIKHNRSDMIKDHWGAYKETPRLNSFEVNKRQRSIQDCQAIVCKLKSQL